MTPSDDNSRRHFLSSVAAAIAGTAAASACEPAPGQRGAGVSPPGPPFRRVVTGFDSTGQSVIVADGPVPFAAQWRQTEAEVAQIGRISGNEVWLLEAVPTNLAHLGDPLLGKLPEGNQPVLGGVIARVAQYEPGCQLPMHTTWTVDLGIVVSGALELTLEAGSAILRPGDIVVQCGTPHGWRVVGDQPCVVVFVLFDAINGHGPRPAA